MGSGVALQLTGVRETIGARIHERFIYFHRVGHLRAILEQDLLALGDLAPPKT